MPLNFATKTFSYNLAKFWANFYCKLYNILLWRMRISQILDFFCGFISNFFLASFAFLPPPPFLFSLSSTLYPLSIHWKSFGLSLSENLEMEHWSTRWLGLFYHQLCTQNWTRFFWYSSAPICSIFKMDTRMDESVLAVLAAYQNNLVTSKWWRHKWLNCSWLQRRENTTLDGKELMKEKIDWFCKAAHSRYIT